MVGVSTTWGTNCIKRSQCWENWEPLGWRNNLAVNRACCSYTGPEYGCRGPCQATHNCQWLQIWGFWCPLLVSSGTHMQKYSTHSQVHKHMHMKGESLLISQNQQAKRRKGVPKTRAEPKQLPGPSQLITLSVNTRELHHWVRIKTWTEGPKSHANQALIFSVPKQLFEPQQT